MDNFEEYMDNSIYDIHKLSQERNERLNKYRNKTLHTPEQLEIEINFTLTNNFWGNSWFCNEQVKAIKGRELRTNINVQNSVSLSEVWDCRVIYFNSIEDHNIYLKSLDKDITVQIFNNNLTCTCDDSHTLSGYVAEKVSVHR